MEKIDTETAESLRQGEAIKNYIDSKGWEVVKQLILDRVRVMDSISALPVDLNQEEMLRQLMLRSGIIDFANGLIADVEAMNEQYIQQANASGIIVEEEIIRTYSTST